ncbi:MAG: glycosyltransferase family 4 protein [Bacteroidota bacterium]
MGSKKQQTLVILTPGFPENEADTTCLPPRQTFVRSLRMVNPELNIVILTLQYPFFSAEYQWHGIRVISFGTKKKGRLYRLLSIYKVWRSLKMLYKEFEVIGLLSFWLGKSAFIADRFAKPRQLPHFCWLLGQDAKPGNPYFKRIKPRGEFLIALSDFIKREFEKNYGEKPQHVIPVGIDTSIFASEDLERDIDIIGVGSLIPLKQYHLFLAVVKQLVVFFPALKALICGDGPEMKSLQEIIKKLGLERHVSLTGSLPHAAVLKLMQRSKVLVHTSSYEGFGTVNLEALYAGAAVVSFVKPMDLPIPNWYVASDHDEMVALVKGILKEQLTNYPKILPYPAAANAKAILQLFGL